MFEHQEYKEVLEVLETVIDEAGYTGKVITKLQNIFRWMFSII